MGFSQAVSRVACRGSGGGDSHYNRMMDHMRRGKARGSDGL